MLFLRRLWRVVVLTLLIAGGGLVQARPLEPLTSVTPQIPGGTQLEFPDNFMVSVKDYGAVGDGATDDTAAIQAALDDQRVDENGNPIHSPPDEYNGRPKALYFPAGTYLVNDTLHWVGCCLTLQGQGSGATLIRLVDSAGGFGDVENPRPVIKTEQGNMSFRQNIWNLSVSTGSNNPGAIGIDYIANNVGAMRDVHIRSEDGQGFTGLAMTRSWPGPCLVSHVSIEGFDYGIRVGPGEYGPTFEHIRLTNQRVAGIYNVHGSLAIRKLTSINSVPVILGVHQASLLTLIDGQFSGGSSAVSAINTQGQIYARNVSADGYRSAITYRDNEIAGTSVDEYFSNSYQLFAGPEHSLKLPIEETPDYHDSNMEHWGRFEPRWYGDTGPLQALLDSGKSTIYFPFATYYSFDEAIVYVPASVKRIVGFSAVVNQDGRGYNGGGIRFVTIEASPDPLIIDGFGYGVKVDHRSPRTVVLKHGGYKYKDAPGAGDLFLEDVNIEPLELRYTRNVWARQLNTERIALKVNNTSADLWILGMKTEGKGVNIRTANGARTELLGTVIMGIHVDTPEDKARPSFVIEDAQVSLIYRLLAYEPARNYDVLIRETRAGVTREFKAGDIPREVPLFSAIHDIPGPPVINVTDQIYLPAVTR